MKKGDVTCSTCGAGFVRLELMSRSGLKGEYRCLACGDLLEQFDGSSMVAYRFTTQPLVKVVRG